MGVNALLSLAKNLLSGWVPQAPITRNETNTATNQSVTSPLEQVNYAINPSPAETNDTAKSSTNTDVNLRAGNNLAIEPEATNPQSTAVKADPTPIENTEIKMEISEATMKNLQPLFNASEKLINRVIELFLQGAKEGLVEMVCKVAGIK